MSLISGVVQECVWRRSDRNHDLELAKHVADVAGHVIASWENRNPTEKCDTSAWIRRRIRLERAPFVFEIRCLIRAESLVTKLLYYRLAIRDLVTAAPEPVQDPQVNSFLELSRGHFSWNIYCAGMWVIPVADLIVPGSTECTGTVPWWRSCLQAGSRTRKPWRGAVSSGDAPIGA